MSTKFPCLFSQGKIGNLEFKNRIFKAPQSTGMSNIDGSVSERLVRYYADQAAGGSGMIIVEYAYIDDIASKSAHCHLGISSNEHIPGLAWLAQVIEENGAVPGIQIEHCGRQKFLGTQPIWGPSEIPWPKLYDSVGLQAVPHAMTIPEIQQVVASFGDAALRAKMAGFKLVEIHGAHGYLLTNFFSPHTNKRTDWYGGSLENRCRIYVEVYEDVRKKVGSDFPIIIRLSGTDYEPDGFPVEDTVYLAKKLESLGINGIHISGGDHHMMIHQVSPMAIPVCHNTWAAEIVKKNLNIPVIASGSITLPEYAEDIISTGKGDFVGLGRPLWADPEWAIKAEEDRPEEVRPCIRCNEGCLERTFFKYQAVTCAVNPLISREGELKIRPVCCDSQKKRIAVVGGGPAGMEAARVLKLRGHYVTLFEAERLGGALHEAGTPDFKSDIRPYMNYLIHQMEVQQINVVMKAATVEELADFEVVINATGAEESKLSIPGADKNHVMSALDVINGKAKPEGKIAMIGGGMVGTETALDLAQAGSQVMIIEMLDHIMDGLAATDFLAYSDMLAKVEMEIHTSSKLLEIKDKSIVIATPSGQQELSADTVVIAIGFRPRTEIFEALKESGKCVYNIGDSVNVGKIMDAIHTAYRLALKI